MFDVTVKTLDSQNHVFNVEDDISVKQFKEKISPTINIPTEQQRLIFRGRVLQDDKKLNEYSVANSVVHVVQRPANQNSTANDQPRPSTPGVNRDGLFPGDDGTGGGGRNAIIMGAIGLPSFGIDSDPNDDSPPTPRRSGATIRLLVGNQLLNRASTLLQQLEDDDATFAAATATASASRDQSSPGSESDAARMDLLNNDTDMDIDFDDEEQEPGSLERMISQVVNVSSAAALVAAIRQVNPSGGGGASMAASGTIPPASNNSATPPTSVGSTSVGDSVPAPVGGSDGIGATARPTSSSGLSAPTSTPAGGNSNSTTSPARRAENPRLRELATALQDLLALQDRLNPFLRFLQEALRQNRLFTEPAETQSTQFLYDSVSNILHLLSHSLHAFSDIACDFSVEPDSRRLTASSSILVEQSTVVRATIPVAVPAMLAQAAANAALGGNNNNTTGGQAQTPATNTTGSATPTNQQRNDHPPAAMATPMALGGFPGFSISLGVPRTGTGAAGGMTAGAVPISIPIPMDSAAMASLLQPGMMPSQPWRNPNLTGSGGTATAAGAGQPQGQQTGQNQPNAQQSQQNNAPRPANQFLTPQQLAAMLPPGLQNLGALLGMPTPNGVQIVGGLNAQGGMISPQNFAGLQQPTPPRSAANESNNTTASGTNASTATPASGVSNGNIHIPDNTNNNNNGGVGAGMFQNLLRNELSRPPFDPLLPCHTHHSSVRNGSRTNRTSRPSEFRRFVNVEGEDTSQVGAGQLEGETVEIIMDLLRNSRLVDLLQPVVKDVVLNYLMRGRDSKNESHVRTCAKGLAKKILPFFEKFSNKAGGRNENIDISATYTNILTGFLTSLMLKIIGHAPGDCRFRLDVLNALTDVQKQMIEAFKVCYPNSTDVGLMFVNYLIEQCLGGMSIVFKSQVREKLLEHLKQLEKKVDTSTLAPPPSLIVYKQGSEGAAASTGPIPVTTPSSSSMGSSEVPAGLSPSKKMAPSAPASTTCITDDVEIDEVLQLPSSMAPEAPVNPRGRGAGTAAGTGHVNQTESFATLMRNLPSEWVDTVQPDIRRQVEMPSQPSFSPGYNTLFPRKH